MARRTDRAVERLDPTMAHAVRASAGEHGAKDAITDRAEELDLHPGGDMLAQRFTVGVTYFIETTNWVYVGICSCVGRDYIEIGSAAKVMSDGRHSTFMMTGTGPNMEIEPTGGPKRRVLIPIDCIGPVCEWPFKIPDHAI